MALARKLEPDRFRALPDPKLYQGQARVDLDLVDPSQGALTAAGRRERAQAAEAGARAVKGAGAILSVTTGFSDVLLGGLPRPLRRLRGLAPGHELHRLAPRSR